MQALRYQCILFLNVPIFSIRVEMNKICAADTLRSNFAAATSACVHAFGSLFVFVSGIDFVNISVRFDPSGPHFRIRPVLIFDVVPFRFRFRSVLFLASVSISVPVPVLVLVPVPRSSFPYPLPSPPSSHSRSPSPQHTPREEVN